MLDVCLLGTSGMMPLPGRWLTALMLRFNGSSLLIDCGEGTQVAVREKKWSFHDIDIICITHFHGDHVSGLPGLLLSMGNSDRTAPVVIIGPRGVERVVTALRVIAPELPFEIRYIELAEAEEHIEINGYNIDAFKVQHNVVCYGYSVSIKRGGRFYPELARQNNVPLKLWSRLQKGESVEQDGVVYTPDMVIGAPRKGIKVTYCTDSRPVPSIERNAKEADLFICEGMYGEAEKVDKAVEHKHMTFIEAAKIANKAEVKEAWLTHYSPSLTRPEMFIGNARKVCPVIKAGKDQMSVTLDFEKDE